ncbi:MAG: DUF5067 domain-containing protein [Clostridium sp.]|nr:DUF5067 domain-containing protein [Clostridium sp.]
MERLKKVVAFIISISMITAFTACSSTGSESSNREAKTATEEKKEDNSDASSESEEEPTEKEAEKSGFEFAVKSTSLSTDYEGEDVLVIEYDFTNNSDKANSFTMSCQDTVFQDGIECDSTVVGCDDVDAQEQLNNVQPGNTYTLKVGYHVQDLSKPVDVIITDLLGTKTLFEETIELNN